MSINTSLYQYLIDDFHAAANDTAKSSAILFNMVILAESDGHETVKAVEMVKSYVSSDPANKPVLEALEQAFRVPRPTHDTAEMTPRHFSP